MKRIATAALILAFVAPLSGCGITGNLKTPPPIWGEPTAAEVPDETTAAQSVEDADDTVIQSDNPLDDDDTEPGYGVDVADQP